MKRQAVAYFVSFRTYGSWLRGDKRGWTHRGSAPEDKVQEQNAAIEAHDMALLKGPRLSLSGAMREEVEGAIRELCRRRGWTLIAIAVLGEHVHMLVRALPSPEQVLSASKAEATRRLRRLRLVGKRQTVWSGHGSTRYLSCEAEVEAVRGYIEQHIVALDADAAVDEVRS